ncbi:LysM peptidoglycan-binding domain-containing protein [Persicitalea sp.]|uniref:lytic transglycosylase domain-containing protein n=1 Tax=Persicitalea sp. TaxID=3100273 RepID=UPI003592FFBF
MNLPKRVVNLATLALLALCNLPVLAVPQLQQDEIIFEESDTLSVAATDLLPEIEEPANRVPTELVRERLGLLEKKIPLVYHAESHKFVEYFIYTKPDFTRRMMEDKNLFFPIYERLLAKHDMPDELKYLSMIESGLNPKIISYAGAGGLWQFMRATGREFGLKQDSYIDERFDPEKSTEAACRYLKQLYRIFGDWEMALASYNCGPGNVKRAMRRSGGNTFWGIYNSLPKQTRGYVPQYVGILYMMHYGEDHGIAPNIIQFPTITDTIQVNGYLNLTTFAALSGVTMEEIQRLNPSIISDVLPEYTRGFALKLPAQKFAFMQPNRLSILDSASQRGLPGVMLASIDEDGEYATKRLRHTVRSGESLTTVARRYGVSISEVKSWNRLRSTRLLRGQRLTIMQKVKVAPRPAAKVPVVLAKNTATKETPDTTEANDKEELVADVSEMEEQPEAKPAKVVRIQPAPKTATYIVRRGDNLTEIAHRYGVSINDVKDWNNLGSGKILVGQKLKIFNAGSARAAPAVASIKSATTRVKPKYHTVQRGDTLWTISQRYGLTVDNIKAANRMKGSKIKAGMKLLISG